MGHSSLVTVIPKMNKSTRTSATGSVSVNISPNPDDLTVVGGDGGPTEGGGPQRVAPSLTFPFALR